MSGRMEIEKYKRHFVSMIIQAILSEVGNCRLCKIFVFVSFSPCNFYRIFSLTEPLKSWTSPELDSLVLTSIKKHLMGLEGKVITTEQSGFSSKSTIQTV